MTNIRTERIIRLLTHPWATIVVVVFLVALQLGIWLIGYCAIKYSPFIEEPLRSREASRFALNLAVVLGPVTVATIASILTFRKRE